MKRQDQEILVIADGAAFGPEMERVMKWIRQKNGILLYLPESFEWLILRSGVVTEKNLNRLLENPEGTYFINIERQKRSTNSCISVYETKSYTCLGKMYEDNDRIEPKWIEFGEDQVPYVLGLTRREDRVMDAAFIARLGRSGLEDRRIITGEEFEFFTDFKRLEMHGFTEEAKQWSGFRYRNVDMTDMEQESHPFKDLWERYGQIQGS